MKTHISVKDLNVSYGGQKALNHISIDIPDKKITAIIGPSGCGKTTLLKSFNRLLDLQEDVRVEGEVLVDGENIYGQSLDVSRLRKKMGLLSQRPQVLPMSIYDNVVYGLRVHGARDKKILDTAVERYLKEANLWHEVKGRLHSSAAGLSIGQQQRLCLARGLAVEPEIILGDEPTSALDPISAEQIEQRLLELKNKYTIVLVTHILRQARRLADYVIFLYMGHLIEHGPAEEVLNHPKYLKTQNYINGTFIEEPVVDETLNLSSYTASQILEKAHGSLEVLGIGRILKIKVNTEADVISISKVFENDVHKILEVLRVEKALWEILIQKQGGRYEV